MILSGKELSNKIQQQLKIQVNALSDPPHLVVILTTDNKASETYVNAKKKAAINVGFKSTIIHDTSLSEAALLNQIDALNQDPNVHGILVQLPLKEGLDEKKIMTQIDPLKDVDGFHPLNVAALFQDRQGFVPATPKGIMRLLEETKIPLAGKKAVIVGRSQIVGKPLIHLLLKENATVCVAHSKTKNLKELTLQADILIAAVGKKALIQKDYVKDQTVIIDVGINRTEKGLVGDVDFEALKDKAAYITPVPGGVGPMTIASLLENTLEAYQHQKGGLHD
jgi:methylenetetrahydrofolate dehydrogenase (NADP+)/methenyltetrahydrofolate cyclohydrolase